MNKIQPIIFNFIPNSGIFEILKPLVLPILKHNFPIVANSFCVGFALGLLLDTCVHHTFSIEQGSKASIITKVAVLALSTLFEVFFAPQFTLLAIPLTALKVAEVSNALNVFKASVVVTAFLIHQVLVKKEERSPLTITPFACLSIAIAGSVFPLTNTLLVSNALGSFLGIAISSVLGTSPNKKKT